MFTQFTNKDVVVLPHQPVYSVDHADGMPFYSMDDDYHVGTWGRYGIFLWDWAKG